MMTDTGTTIGTACWYVTDCGAEEEYQVFIDAPSSCFVGGVPGRSASWGVRPPLCDAGEFIPYAWLSE